MAPRHGGEIDPDRGAMGCGGRAIDPDGGAFDLGGGAFDLGGRATDLEGGALSRVLAPGTHLRAQSPPSSLHLFFARRSISVRSSPPRTTGDLRVLTSFRGSPLDLGHR